MIERAQVHVDGGEQRRCLTLLKHRSSPTRTLADPRQQPFVDIDSFMPARSLTPEELATRCDPATLALEELATQHGNTVDDAGSIVGQARARAAVEYGIAMTRRGHHLFVMGPSGAGKETLVRRAIEAQLARSTPQRFDWVYVNNFEQPHKPRALQLPAGRGVELRKHMRALVDELRTMIPATFESDEYVNAVERLNAEFKDKAERSVLEVGEQAQRNGLAIIRTPVGFSFAPRKGESEVLSGAGIRSLASRGARTSTARHERGADQLLRTLRASVRLRKEHSDRLRALNRSMTLVAIQHAVDEARGHYADLPHVCSCISTTCAPM